MGGLVRVVAAACLAAFVEACDPADLVSAPPPTACTQLGAQCQLAGGPLGVCESAPCADGATPPCLTCTPQH